MEETAYHPLNNKLSGRNRHQSKLPNCSLRPRVGLLLLSVTKVRTKMNSQLPLSPQHRKNQQTLLSSDRAHEGHPVPDTSVDRTGFLSCCWCWRAFWLPLRWFPITFLEELHKISENQDTEGSVQTSDKMERDPSQRGGNEMIVL